MAPASRGLRAPSSGLFGSPPQYEFKRFIPSDGSVPEKAAGSGGGGGGGATTAVAAAAKLKKKVKIGSRNLPPLFKPFHASNPRVDHHYLTKSCDK